MIKIQVNLTYKPSTPNVNNLALARLRLVRPNHIRLPNLRPIILISASSSTSPTPQNNTKINYNNNDESNNNNVDNFIKNNYYMNGAEDGTYFTKAKAMNVFADLLIKVVYYFYVRTCVMVFTQLIPGLTVSRQKEKMKTVNKPTYSLIQRIQMAMAITQGEVQSRLRQVKKLIYTVKIVIRVNRRYDIIFGVAMNIMHTTIKFGAILAAISSLVLVGSILKYLEARLNKKNK